MEKKVSILIIDDDEGMLKTLNYILVDKGYEVVACRSGAEGIALVNKRSFDIALVDIKMPGMDGVAVLKAIKKLSPETSIMMITAYTMHKLVEEAKKEGVKAVFPKPLDIDKMIAYTDGLTRNNKAVEEHSDSNSPDLLQILDEKEREIQEKSLLIEELKKSLAEIKENPVKILDQERKKRQSENIHTILNTKQLELFKILREEERSYNEIFDIASSKKLAIRDMHALRLQLSRLDKKLMQETNFKIVRRRRDTVLYFTIASD
jgi:DNA-binding response OmpR family regulator